MDLLRKIFFPGILYPMAVIWHIIFGSLVAALIGYFSFGYDGHGHLWLPITGSAVAIIIGYLLSRK